MPYFLYNTNQHSKCKIPMNRFYCSRFVFHAGPPSTPLIHDTEFVLFLENVLIVDSGEQKGDSVRFQTFLRFLCADVNTAILLGYKSKQTLRGSGISPVCLWWKRDPTSIRLDYKAYSASSSKVAIMVFIQRSFFRIFLCFHSRSRPGHF